MFILCIISERIYSLQIYPSILGNNENVFGGNKTF